jgi:hypothetical protein
MAFDVIQFSVLAMSSAECTSKHPDTTMGLILFPRKFHGGWPSSSESTERRTFSVQKLWHRK